MRNLLISNAVFLGLSAAGIGSLYLAAAPPADEAAAAQNKAPEQTDEAAPHEKAPMPTDDEVPQDKARMEKQARDRLAWNRATLGEAYEKVGRKDPQWDEAARKALETGALYFSRQNLTLLEATEVYEPAKKAVDAGCDDPLVLYFYARFSVGTNYPGEPEFYKRMEVAAEALGPSRYPPIRKAAALAKDAYWKASGGITPEERQAIGRDLSKLLDLAVEDADSDPKSKTEDWKLHWYQLLDQVYVIYKSLGMEPPAAFERINSRLSKNSELDALRLTLKGKFLLFWAWDARGQCYANQVSDEQFRLFFERLEKAKEAFEEAWKLDPGQPGLANLRLGLEKGIGHGDRQAMETWFRRAMLADGNDYNACWNKLDWLDPKWYGESYEEMIDFGRACAATGNWRTGITLLVADAHFRYFYHLTGNEAEHYLDRPEVWAEIKPVYEEYLKHYPNDYAQKSKYAMFCYFARQMRKAHDLFQDLGENLTTWPSSPHFSLPQMKQMRDRAAQILAEHPEL